MEKIVLGLGLKPNIALGFTSCYISLSTMPLRYFFHIALAAVLQLVIVLVGLFEQIARVLLGAIERQLTRKVCSFALANYSKAVCLC